MIPGSPVLCAAILGPVIGHSPGSRDQMEEEHSFPRAEKGRSHRLIHRRLGRHSRGEGRDAGDRRYHPGRPMTLSTFSFLPKRTREPKAMARGSLFHRCRRWDADVAVAANAGSGDVADGNAAAGELGSNDAVVVVDEEPPPSEPVERVVARCIASGMACLLSQRLHAAMVAAAAVGDDVGEERSLSERQLEAVSFQFPTAENTPFLHRPQRGDEWASQPSLPPRCLPLLVGWVARWKDLLRLHLVTTAFVSSLVHCCF